MSITSCVSCHPKASVQNATRHYVLTSRSCLGTFIACLETKPLSEQLQRPCNFSFVPLCLCVVSLSQLVDDAMRISFAQLALSTQTAWQEVSSAWRAEWIQGFN